MWLKNKTPFRKGEIKTGMYVKIQVSNFHRFPKKIITWGWYKVIGIKDGIKLIASGKTHRRSKPSKWNYPFNIYAQNVLDIASDRDEMIARREMR